MTSEKQTFELADGKKLVIRTPTPDADLKALTGFLSSLPEEQRIYLRYDVTREDGCLARLKQVDGRHHFRLVAEVDGKMVADGTLDREVFFWSRHVAELRCVISKEGMRLGVGPRLIHELVGLGHSVHDIEILFTEVMPEQTDIIAMMAEVGFVYEATRRRVAKDIQGGYHDLQIMANELDRVWKRLEQQLQDQDNPYFSGQY
jgi:hypothetical protein